MNTIHSKSHHLLHSIHIFIYFFHLLPGLPISLFQTFCCIVPYFLLFQPSIQTNAPPSLRQVSSEILCDSFGLTWIWTRILKCRILYLVSYRYVMTPRRWRSKTLVILTEALCILLHCNGFRLFRETEMVWDWEWRNILMSAARFTSKLFSSRDWRHPFCHWPTGDFKGG